MSIQLARLIGNDFRCRSSRSFRRTGIFSSTPTRVSAADGSTGSLEPRSIFSCMARSLKVSRVGLCRTATSDLLYQNMAEDHTYKGVGECHPYREFEGMQPSR